MAKSIKGTQTEKNLLTAFAGESQARNRYTFFASVAKKEGYEQISNIFTETAGNEKEHADIFFKYLKGGDVEITARYPAGVVGNTLQNLEAAADGEKMEWSEIYKDMKGTAAKEGFKDIATSFKEISEVEEKHEERYKKILAKFKEQMTYKRAKPIKWKCANCGYVHEGTEAPEECPACGKPRNFYEPWCENY